MKRARWPPQGIAQSSFALAWLWKAPNKVLYPKLLCVFLLLSVGTRYLLWYGMWSQTGKNSILGKCLFSSAISPFPFRNYVSISDVRNLLHQKALINFEPFETYQKYYVSSESSLNFGTRIKWDSHCVDELFLQKKEWKPRRVFAALRFCGSTAFRLGWLNPIL